MARSFSPFYAYKLFILTPNKAGPIHKHNMPNRRKTSTQSNNKTFKYKMSSRKTVIERICLYNEKKNKFSKIKFISRLLWNIFVARHTENHKLCVCSCKTKGEKKLFVNLSIHAFMLRAHMHPFLSRSSCHLWWYFQVMAVLYCKRNLGQLQINYDIELYVGVLINFLYLLPPLWIKRNQIGIKTFLLLIFSLLFGFSVDRNYASIEMIAKYSSTFVDQVSSFHIIRSLNNHNYVNYFSRN